MRTIRGGAARPERAGVGVLHVVWTLEFGGLENVAIDLAAHTPPRYGPEVCVLGAGGGLLRRAEKLGLRCHVMAKRRGRDLLLPLRIGRLVRQGRFDLVHTHNPGAHLYGLLGGRLGGARGIITTRHGTGYSGKKAGAPWIWKRTHRVVAVSEDARRQLLARCAVDPGRVAMIPNGIDLAPYREPLNRELLRRGLGWGIDEPVAGTVARLVPEKAQKVMLEAFARAVAAGHPGRLVLVGDGPCRADLERHAARLGLSRRVEFLGFRRDVPTLLRAMDVFVLSSRMEGMALTLIEAMAAGLPVVATDVGGNREVVAEGITGRLVPPGDPEALGGALRALFGDRAARARLGGTGRCRAEERFSADRMAGEYATLYDEVLAAGARRAGPTER